MIKTTTKAASNRNSALMKSADIIKKTAIENTIKKNKSNDALIDMITCIIDAIDDIKGENIIMIDVRQLKDCITDYFVIAQAETNVQVKAISEHIMRRVRNELAQRPISKEGLELGEWVCMDYVNIVIHIMRRDRREYYRIEDLWSDGIIKNMELTKPVFKKTVKRASNKV